jgi:hypothetical protein
LFLKILTANIFILAFYYVFKELHTHLQELICSFHTLFYIQILLITYLGFSQSEAAAAPDMTVHVTAHQSISVGQNMVHLTAYQLLQLTVSLTSPCVQPVNTKHLYVTKCVMITKRRYRVHTETLV